MRVFLKVLVLRLLRKSSNETLETVLKLFSDVSSFGKADFIWVLKVDEFKKPSPTTLTSDPSLVWQLRSGLKQLSCFFR